MKMKDYLIFMAFLLASTYLLAAFAMWEMDPALWPAEMRAAWAAAVGFAGVFGFLHAKGY